MSAFSVYTSNKVLDLLLNASAFSAPTPYVGLFTSSAGLDTNVVGSQTEVSGSSYARVNASACFHAASSGSISNDTVIDFPAATASWGVVTHFAILDAATGGNVLIWGALTNSKTIDSGDAIRFAIGALTASLT